MARSFTRPIDANSLAALARKSSTRVARDVNPVGEGVCEMREFFGPGWRMYYIQRGKMLIVMLGGGDKSTQAKDIVAAKALAVMIKE